MAEEKELNENEQSRHSTLSLLFICQFRSAGAAPPAKFRNRKSVDIYRPCIHSCMHACMNQLMMVEFFGALQFFPKKKS